MRTLHPDMREASRGYKYQYAKLLAFHPDKDRSLSFPVLRDAKRGRFAYRADF
jgi:hypothetical protein